MEEINAWKYIDQLVKKQDSISVNFFENNTNTTESDSIIFCKKYNTTTQKWMGCGEPGHTFRTCPLNKCKTCNQVGHLNLDCPFVYSSPVKEWTNTTYGPPCKT